MLEKIDIEATDLTPSICMDSYRALIRIKGVLVPENAFEFFNPIFKWLDEYKLANMDDLRVEFELDYFNTSSSRIILELMKQVQKIANNTIVWIMYSDDEDMLEVVNDYNELLGGTIEINIRERNLIA